MKTLNPHSDFTLSYLGEVSDRAEGVAFKFFFGDFLTWIDVFDWHVILKQNSEFFSEFIFMLSRHRRDLIFYFTWHIDSP